MNRRPWLLLLFTLGLSSPALAQTVRHTEPSASSTVPWVPRGASLSVALRRGAVLPEARLQWQLLFYRSIHDSLGLLIEPSASVAALKPSSLPTDAFLLSTSGAVSQLYFYSLLLGIGYTNRTDLGLEWGFQVGTGPTWFHARLTNAPARESSLVGMLEGRARVGYRFGSVGMGITVGYGDPYNYRRSSRARAYVGGLQLGLYADWR